MYAFCSLVVSQSFPVNLLRPCCPWAFVPAVSLPIHYPYRIIIIYFYHYTCFLRQVLYLQTNQQSCHHVKWMSVLWVALKQTFFFVIGGFSYQAFKVTLSISSNYYVIKKCRLFFLNHFWVRFIILSWMQLYNSMNPGPSNPEHYINRAIVF